MLADIKIAHSVFALPFALLGAAMVAWPPEDSGVQALSGGHVAIAVVLVIAAMVAARTAAMLSNRLLDRELDARNPRTAGRPLASGEASVRSYKIGLLTAAAGIYCHHFALLVVAREPLATDALHTCARVDLQLWLVQTIYGVVPCVAWRIPGDQRSGRCNCRARRSDFGGAKHLVSVGHGAVLGSWI